MENIKSKKILFIMHSAAEGGGAEDDALRIIKYLKAKGNYIHILTPIGKLVDEYKVHANKLTIYKKTFFPVSNSPLKEYIQYFLVFFKHKNIIQNLIKTEKFDVCIINVVVLLWFMYFLKKTNIPIITIVRETIYPDLIRKIIYKFIVKYVKYFVFVSNENRKDFTKICKKDDNSFLYYATFEDQNISDNKDLILKTLPANVSQKIISSNFKIIISGSLSKRKNQLELIYVLDYFKKNRINLPYIFLTGDPEMHVSYTKLIYDYVNNNNYQENVFILGILEKNLYYTVLKEMNALVIVSKSEGLPLVIFEAFKYHVPVISYDVGGVKDVLIDDYNALIPQRSLSSLFLSIKKLMENDVKRKELIRNGHQTFEKYSDLNKSLKIFNDLIYKLDE